MKRHAALGRYLLQRLLQAIAVLLAALTLAFIVLRIVPGDPARLILGGANPGQAPTEEQLAAIRHEYGFDRNVVVQYFSYLGNALRGDLGQSYQNGRPVTSVMAEALPGTIRLALFALLIAIVAGSVLAALIAYPRSRWLPSLVEGIPAIGVSAPTFWVGLLLIQVFAFRLHLFPSAGQSGFSSLVLPAVTMSIASAAVFAQVLARSLGVAMQEPFVTVVAAKGASRRREFVHHALRSALLPAVTALGVQAANMFVLSTITETVFSRNGVGSVLARAVKFKDIPLVLGITVFVVGIYVLVNLVVDVLYPVIDPRLRGADAATSATSEPREVDTDEAERARFAVNG